MINEGRYRARAIVAEVGQAETGTKYVNVPFRLLEEPNAGAIVIWHG